MSEIIKGKVVQEAYRRTIEFRGFLFTDVAITHVYPPEPGRSSVSDDRERYPDVTCHRVQGIYQCFTKPLVLIHDTPSRCDFEWHLIPLKPGERWRDAKIRDGFSSMSLDECFDNLQRWIATVAP